MVKLNAIYSLVTIVKIITLNLNGLNTLNEKQRYSNFVEKKA